jgi:hypothetical protein
MTARSTRRLVAAAGTLVAAAGLVVGLNAGTASAATRDCSGFVRAIHAVDAQLAHATTASQKQALLRKRNRLLEELDRCENAR